MQVCIKRLGKQMLLELLTGEIARDARARLPSISRDGAVS